jgi:hypothetical protein
MIDQRVPGTPERRLPRAAAAALWLLALGIPLCIGVLVLVSPLPEQDAWAIPLYSLIVATWGMTGAFLVSRRPENRVGWVLVSVGLGMGTSMIATLWAGLSLAVHEGSLPGTALASVLSTVFFPSLYLVMLVPLLFPDGRVMSRRWGGVALLLLAAAGMTFAGSLLLPGELECMPGVDNPLGVPALTEVAQLLVALGGLASLLCLPAGILAAILRYRRGTPVERKQLKWFGSVLVLAFSAFFAATILPQPYGQWSWILASLCMGLIPIAIGIAILRYRLYDIDRIVSRTLSYALVTGVLALVFIGTNLALQSVLSLATGGSTLTVAASTLVVAALFQPMRRRIQAPIDRRFNRARSDAELVVARFSARTRDEVDLDQLHGSVITTIQEAVHPAGAGLWLRRAR